jgi:glycine cleavage system H protein
LLNIEPYEAWIARVRPSGSVEDALAAMVTGDAAQAGYCERTRREDIQCERGAR